MKLGRYGVLWQWLACAVNSVAAAQSEYHSVGVLSPLPKRTIDLATPGGSAAARTQDCGASALVLRSAGHHCLLSLGPTHTAAAARQVAQARSYKGELIMFTADAQMAGWGFHWVTLTLTLALTLTLTLILTLTQALTVALGSDRRLREVGGAVALIHEGFVG